MNEKEVAEIRRRFKPEKSAVTHVRGCYVSAQGEVVSHFDQSLALMPQEEGENLMNLLRKTLSGGLGRNLLNLSFSTAQVVDSPEHKLLMALRDSQLQDQDAVEAFFQQVAASFRLEDMGYLILLALRLLRPCPTGERTAALWRTPRRRCTPTFCVACAR